MVGRTGANACSLPRYDDVIGGGVVGTDAPLVFDVGEFGPTLGVPVYGSPAPCVRFVVQPKAASDAMSENARSVRAIGRSFKFLFFSALRMRPPFETAARNWRYLEQ